MLSEVFVSMESHELIVIQENSTPGTVSWGFGDFRKKIFFSFVKLKKKSISVMKS